MKTAAITVSAIFATAVNAQVQYVNGSFVCPSNTPTDGAYCAGASLSSNIIIRCNGTVGQAGNCNDNLAGVSPVGVKTDALCYQTSETAGDAACSFDDVVYPDSGSSYTISGTSATASSYSSSSTGIVYVTSPATTTAASVYTTSATDTASTAVVTASSSPVTYTVPVASTTATSNSSGNATTTAVPPVYTGAAAMNVKSGALVGMMIAAVAAALL